MQVGERTLKRSNEAWQRFVRLSNRAVVAEFVDGEEGFILTEFFAGEPFHRAIVCIGRNPTNANGRFCLDLSIAPETWRSMTDVDIRAEIARKGTQIASSSYRRRALQYRCSRHALAIAVRSLAACAAAAALR